MLGILLLLYFLVVGYCYADLIFKDKDVFVKLWIGIVFGLILLMFGIVPFAFLFGFSILSHILLIVTVGGVYALIAWKKKTRPALPRFKGSELLKMLWVVCPIALIMITLMYNHILMPVENGAFASGQSTYGDLSIHLSIITGLAQQQSFPPDYSIMPGHLLSYPFLADSLSASLMLFGLDLRWAILLPSFVFAIILVMGLYILSYSIIKKHSVSILSCILFFFNGGFGFFYFLENAKISPENFTRIFTDYYHTPTNYNEMNIRWSNTICDMIIPQRTTMVGWAVVLLAIYLLYQAITGKNRRYYIVLGVVAGAMPMIHTHSFLSLGIISAAAFFVFLFGEKDRKEYLINWIIYGAIAIGMALPQLVVWTFNQAASGEFIKPGFNWVNENDPYLWFWIKNVGLVFLLVVPAFLAANKELRKFYIPFIFVFAAADLIIFQPLVYDNNKVFYVWYMLTVILVANYLQICYEKLKEVKGRSVLAACVIFFCIFSGVLTMGREYASGGQYVIYSKTDFEAADFIKENTPADALFITGRQHLNPVSALAGRDVYVGPDLYLHFHGFKNETPQRAAVLKEVYESNTSVEQLADQYDFDYVYISNYERNDFKINESKFSGLQTVYSQDGTVIYKVD